MYSIGTEMSLNVENEPYVWCGTCINIFLKNEFALFFNELDPVGASCQN